MQAFHFFTKLDQTLVLGLRARTVGELLTGIQSVPDSSIYHHTHRFLHQHHFLSPEPPNDFAYWVTNVLGDNALGEQLWSVDAVRFQNIASLREKLIAILESHKESQRRISHSLEGGEFHFMASRIFVLPTTHIAHSLTELADEIGRVSIHSVYFHLFDAKLRLKYGENDFTRWFRDQGTTTLADETKRLDPYSYTLDGLRQRIIALVRQHESA
jgi:hypothetical protein